MVAVDMPLWIDQPCKPRSRSQTENTTTELRQLRATQRPYSRTTSHRARGLRHNAGDPAPQELTPPPAPYCDTIGRGFVARPGPSRRTGRQALRSISTTLVTRSAADIGRP